MGGIRVGAVMGDAAQNAGSVGQAFGRVAEALRRQRVDVPVQLVFEFPGQLFRPDHEGLRVRRLRDGGVEVWIAVPDSINGDPDPERRILALAGSALHATLARGVNRAATQELLSATARDLGRPTVAPEPLPASALRSVPTIVLRWTMSDSGQVDELLEFEAALDAALEADGLGSVDGNEIGGGAFELFVLYTKGRKRDVLRRIQELADDLTAKPTVE